MMARHFHLHRTTAAAAAALTAFTVAAVAAPSRCLLYLDCNTTISNNRHNSLRSPNRDATVLHLIEAISCNTMQYLVKTERKWVLCDNIVYAALFDELCKNLCAMPSWSPSSSLPLAINSLCKHKILFSFYSLPFSSSSSSSSWEFCFIQHAYFLCRLDLLQSQQYQLFLSLLLLCCICAHFFSLLSYFTSVLLLYIFFIFVLLSSFLFSALCFVWFVSHRCECLFVRCLYIYNTHIG